MLSIKNLSVSVENKEIIKNLSLDVQPGTVHVIMGPNGSGKSTLANVLARNSVYDVTEGNINFDGNDLLEMETDEAARAGLFLSFQYPVALPGVSNIQFLKTAVNSVRESQGLPPFDAVDFLDKVKSTMKELSISQDFLSRPVNDGFSGGEKKRNEILQMVLLQPKLCILDEIDSGLDIDALKAVADGVNSQRSPLRSFILVTHYQRLLDYITPDVVHVMARGKIIKSGDKNLPHELETKGYDWLLEGADA